MFEDASGPADPEGRTLEIKHSLGSGGFGEVYLANLVSMAGVSTEVAVKILHRGLDPRSQAAQRLRDEARMLGLLNHPSIPHTHGLVQLDGRVALVNEYIPGLDLSECLLGDDRLPPRAVVEVVARVAEVLEAAWSAPGTNGEPLRLVHRDVKPSNIRVGQHGQVKLLDFGIAKASDGPLDREARTETLSIMGSERYMAPLRFDPAHEADPADDVYSLGCSLFEALAGDRLFGGIVRQERYNQAFQQATHDAFVASRIDTLASQLPPRLLEVLRSMLAYRAEDRPSPGALAATLDDVAEALDGPTLRRWARARTWPSADAAATGELAGRRLTETQRAPASQTAELTGWGESGIVFTDSADLDAQAAQAVQAQRNLYRMRAGVLGLGWSAHAAYGLTFALLGHPRIGLANVPSLLWYFVAMALYARGRHRLALDMAMAHICAFMPIFTLAFGFDSGGLIITFGLMVAPFLVYSAAEWRARVVIVGSTLASALAVIVFLIAAPPFIHLTPFELRVLLVVNSLSMVAILLVLGLWWNRIYQADR